MEVTGFAFGTIALVGPLASACLSAYGLLKDIRSIDGDAADFRLLVDTQMALLSLWVKTWVHFDLCADITAMPQVHKSGKLRAGAVSSIGEEGCLLVVRILAKISKTLADARTLQSVYGIKLTPIPISGNKKAGSSSTQREINNLQVEIVRESPPAESKKVSSPKVASMSSTSNSASSDLDPQAGAKGPDHGLRSWLRRASCSKLCTRDKEEKGPVPRKAVSQADATGHRKRRNLPSNQEVPPNPVLNQQMIDTSGNIAGLEAAKEDIFDNLSKIRCLRWALSDKEKGMTLARELQQWNENLFKILPLKRLETPGKIRAGKHYTPPQSSPLFTGRAEVLDFLENVFFATEPKPRQRRAVLHGLGGAGKTQIALKFAEEHISQFDSIFWVNATTDNTVEESFREIAEHLKISGRHLVNAVRHRLGSLSDYNYLMIFDNADNLPTLSNYFPGGKHGNILVTSRNPRTTDIVSDINKQAFEVDRMSQSDACDLLRRAARLSSEEFSRTEMQKIARAIVGKLGYLALAIEQAGAYIANTCSIGEYLGIYDKIRPMLMSTREFHGSGYAASAYQTWELSFEAVKEKNPAAAELLLVLGYFHYEGIPRELFETGSAAFVRASAAATGGTKLSQLGTLVVESVAKCNINSNESKLASPDETSTNTTWVPFRFDQAMETLCSYSLVKQQVQQDRTSPSYTVHPLVHCWIRDRCEPNALERQRAQCTAIALLQEAMLTDESHGGYVLRSRLVSHLDAWVRPYLDTQKAGICAHTEEERMGVLEAAGQTYHEIGRLDDAESLRERILEWRFRNLGATDSATARARVNLAMTYRQKGNFQKAMVLDEETLQFLLQSESQGPEHPETLQAMLNLAWTYATAGNVSGAEKLERDVIAVRRKLHGPDSIEVAMARGNLGMTLWRQARYKEAEEELGVALERKLAVYGKDHPSTLLTMGNLASALRGEKRWMAAEELGREVVKIRMSILGEKHKDVARALANLGATLLEAGRAAEAYDLQMQALEMFKETVGEYNVQTIDTMENLGRVLIELGRDVEAVEVLGDLVNKRGTVLGEAHPATLEAMKMLGSLREQGAMLNQANEIERKESERQEIDKKNRERLAGQTVLTAPANNSIAKSRVGVNDTLSAESKKRRDELVLLGLFTDRWNIAACF